MSESQQVTEGTTNDSVEIPDATDEDLDAYLELSQISEASPQEQEQPTEKVEEAQPEEKKPEASRPPVKTQEDLEAENQALQRRLEQQELFIRRRSTEIGELRKQLKERNDGLKEDLDSKYIGDTAQSVKVALEIEKNELRLADLENQQTDMERVHAAQKVFSMYVQPGEVSVDDMAACLVNDGIAPEFVEQFKRDPYRSTTPETLVHVAKRAKAEKTLSQVVAFAKAQHQRIKELETGSSAESVVKRIERAAKQTSTVTASSGGSRGGAKPSVSSADIASLSDAELNELLKMK